MKNESLFQPISGYLMAVVVPALQVSSIFIVFIAPFWAIPVFLLFIQNNKSQLWPQEKKLLKVP